MDATFIYLNFDTRKHAGVSLGARVILPARASRPVH
jgi:hypothetical protein